jgi:hypothetical protein
MQVIFYNSIKSGIHSYHRDNAEFYSAVYLGSTETKFIFHDKIFFPIRQWKNSMPVCIIVPMYGALEMGSINNH